jgi:hypothetical protein
MSLALVLLAFVFAVLAMLNVAIPRISLIGAALAFYFASLLVGHVPTF